MHLPLPAVAGAMALTGSIFGKIIPNMQSDTSLNRVLDAAVRRLLRPLVRVLLRHGVPFDAFEAMARRVYVEVALADFALPDKKASASRASILTGLNRKEVARVMAVTADGAAETTARYNRAARVLTAWAREPEYLYATGKPRALPDEGAVSFAALVKRHSGDMPARAVLDELLRVGAVERTDDGQLGLVNRAYVPRSSEIDKLGILGADVADLIGTIDHNLQHGMTDPRFQRKVMYQSIDASALPAFRKLSATQGQALLEKLDRWLVQRDTDPNEDAPDAPRARVGMGIYYFEEPVAQGPGRPAPVKPESDPK
jgi:Family of unknown function (DUF6502)